MNKINCKMVYCEKYQKTLDEKAFNDWNNKYGVKDISWKNVCDYIRNGHQKFEDFEVEQCVNYEWIKRDASEIIFDFILDTLYDKTNLTDEYIDYMETEIL